MQFYSHALAYNFIPYWEIFFGLDDVIYHTCRLQVLIDQLENIYTIELLKSCSLEVSDGKFKLMT